MSSSLASLDSDPTLRAGGRKIILPGCYVSCYPHIVEVVQNKEAGQALKGHFLVVSGKEILMAEKKRAFRLAMVVALALITATWQASAAEKKGNPGQKAGAGVNGKVAVVNGVSIARADFDRALGLAKQQFSRMGKPVDAKEIEARVLDQLIGSELLWEEAKKAGIQVDGKAVDERLGQWKKRFPTDEAYKKALDKMNISEDQVRADIKRNLTIEKLIVQRIVDKIAIPEKEAKQYYDTHTDMFKQPEKVQASHILIKVDPEAKQSDRDEALKKIKEIQQKQKKGEDFGELAKANSQCPSSSNGGDLGFFARGQMVPAFEEAAFSLKPGEVSDIVKTRFGYHLIKVTDKKPESTVPFEDIKERIEQYLKQGEVQKEVRELVDKLRKDAKVEIFHKSDS